MFSILFYDEYGCLVEPALELENWSLEQTEAYCKTRANRFTCVILSEGLPVSLIEREVEKND